MLERKTFLKFGTTPKFLKSLEIEIFLKGECGRCIYKDKCIGCRGRAYEENGDMLAEDPGCWLISEDEK